MAYNSTTERNVSLKKLSGKAQTSNDKGLANEGLPSGITLASNTIFGRSVTTNPSDLSLYTITGNVEYVRFPATFIAGTDTSDGRHGFELKLPSDYESNSSNPLAGTYPFKNNQTINITSGSLQLVPPSFSNSYEAKPFYGGSGTKGSGTQIPILDARDWFLDYFNGILFQQDPPGTGDHAENPDFVEAFLYIGDMLSKVMSGVSGSLEGVSDAAYLVVNATSDLDNERIINTGIGLHFNDGGAGSNYTLSIDNDVVATLTGSQFSGNVGVTGSFTVGGKSLPGDDTNFFVSGSINSKGTDLGGTSVFGGDLAVSGALALNQGAAAGSQVFVTTDGKVGIGTDSPSYKLTVGGSMEVGSHIYHRNDTDTFIQFADDAIGITAGGEQLITISEAGQDIVKIGDGGDVDFQVRTLNDDNTLYVRGDTDRVGIGLNGPATTVHIKDSGPGLRMQREANSEDSVFDFAGSAGSVGASIKHAGDTNDMVFSVFNGSTTEEILRLGDHHGSDNRQVIFLSGSTMHAGAMQPRNCPDIGFFVSGSIDSIGKTSRGAAVFGGDVVISGSSVHHFGLSGSLQRLADGTSYLRPGPGVLISTGSSGEVTIFNTGIGDSGASYLVLNATASLSNERVVNIGTGLQFSDGGAGGNYTIEVEKELIFNDILSGVADGQNTRFILSNTPFTSSEISVFVNGLLQMPPEKLSFYDFSVVGSSIYFTTASTPPEGSWVMANYYIGV